MIFYIFADYEATEQIYIRGSLVPDNSSADEIQYSPRVRKQRVHERYRL